MSARCLAQLPSGHVGSSSLEKNSTALIATTLSASCLPRRPSQSSHAGSLESLPPDACAPRRPSPIGSSWWPPRGSTRSWRPSGRSGSSAQTARCRAPSAPSATTPSPPSSSSCRFSGALGRPALSGSRGGRPPGWKRRVQSPRAQRISAVLVLHRSSFDAILTHGQSGCTAKPGFPYIGGSRKVEHRKFVVRCCSVFV